jgi:hypothetical protein
MTPMQTETVALDSILLAGISYQVEAALLSIPVENSPLYRSKNPPPPGDDGLQFQPAG